ncbi:MAG TPA: hypothetical protein DCS91_19130, partial [Microcoleaceae bacterium UBA11344]|nr:hypothetical protein [Microcoleaceae cyanobacterium UBA11344]
GVFLRKIRAFVIKVNIWDLNMGSSNRVSTSLNQQVFYANTSTRFLAEGRSRGIKKPGFLTNISVGMQKLSQKPGFWETITPPEKIG